MHMYKICLAVYSKNAAFITKRYNISSCCCLKIGRVKKVKLFL